MNINNLNVELHVVTVLRLPNVCVGRATVIMGWLEMEIFANQVRYYFVLKEVIVYIFPH